VPDLNYSRLYQKLQVTILKDEHNVVAVAWPDKRNGGVMHAQGKRMEQTLNCQRSITAWTSSLSQMLNCCINHRNGRSSAAATTDAASEMVEEDEFFDAVEDAASDQWQSAGAGGAEATARYSAWNQPQGREEKTKLKLLKTAETLYIPVTQVRRSHRLTVFLPCWSCL
jgi:hypothetical protein